MGGGGQRLRKTKEGGVRERGQRREREGGGIEGDERAETVERERRKTQDAKVYLIGLWLY